MERKRSCTSYLKFLNDIEKEVRSDLNRGKHGISTERKSATLLNYYNEAIDTLDEEWKNEDYIIISLRHAILLLSRDQSTATNYLNLIGFNNGNAHVFIAIAEYYLKTGKYTDAKISLERARNRHAEPKHLVEQAEKLLRQGTKSLANLIHSRFSYEPPEDSSNDDVTKENTSIVEDAINQFSILESGVSVIDEKTPMKPSDKLHSTTPPGQQKCLQEEVSRRALQPLTVASVSPPEKESTSPFDQYIVDGVNLLSPGDFTGPNVEETPKNKSPMKRFPEDLPRGSDRAAATSPKTESPERRIIESISRGDTVCSVAALLRSYPCHRRGTASKQQITDSKSSSLKVDAVPLDFGPQTPLLDKKRNQSTPRSEVSKGNESFNRSSDTFGTTQLTTKSTDFNPSERGLNSAVNDDDMNSSEGKKRSPESLDVCYTSRARHIPLKRQAQTRHSSRPMPQLFRPPSIPFTKPRTYPHIKPESRVPQLSSESPEEVPSISSQERPFPQNSIFSQHSLEFNNSRHSGDPTPSSKTSTHPQTHIISETNESITCPSSSFVGQQEPKNIKQDEFSFSQLPDRETIRINGVVYGIVSIIGKGGSSVVYEATTGSGETVAIKVVSFKKLDENIIASYKNEVVILARLQDINRVIRLYDYETTDTGMALVMERAEVDFKSVHAHLTKKAGRNETDGGDPMLPASQVIHLWKEMLQCVEALHDKGVIHLDLKPSNFVLVKGIPKLIDLGISHAIPDDMTSVTLQHSMGTLNYMSPEQWASLSDPKRNQTAMKKRIGRSSDVWALGCILHLLMFGKAPMGGLHFIQRMQQILSDQPVPIPDYPSMPKLKEVLSLCLQKNHVKRPSVSTLLKFLTEIGS